VELDNKKSGNACLAREENRNFPGKARFLPFMGNCLFHSELGCGAGQQEKRKRHVHLANGKHRAKALFIFSS
jgi:hypothetical protein